MRRSSLTNKSITFTLFAVLLIANYCPTSDARVGKNEQKYNQEQQRRRRPRRRNLSDDNTTISDDEYVVTFSDMITIMGEDDGSIANTTKSMAEYLSHKYNIETVEVYTPSSISSSPVVTGFSAKNVTLQDAFSISHESGVLSVEKDEIISLDPIEDVPLLEEDFELSTFSLQHVPWGVESIGWEDVEGNEDYADKKVFIIDTGIAFLPHELNIDTTLAKNFVTQYPSDWEDCNGHGTHIAGTIGAKNNDFGVVGIAAGITVVPIRVMDCYGRGKISTLVSALSYVASVARDGDVINVSLGGPVFSTAMDVIVQNAARDLGVRFTIAAGNAGMRAAVFSPARAEGDGIYTVCATDRYGEIPFYSNWGIPPIDVCAPGHDVESLSVTGGLRLLSGTSMAAPHVAGLVVLGKLGIGMVVREEFEDYNITSTTNVTRTVEERSVVNKRDGLSYPMALKL